jgi:SSS family solute:Na+ symporter
MIQIIMIVTYMALTAAVSFISARHARKSTQSFYVAGGSMGMIVVAALLFSEIIAGSGTIGNAQNAFNGGLSNAIWANWGMALGCFLVVFTVAKFYRAMATKYNAVTIPQAYAVMFGPGVRVLMVFIVALAYIIMYSTQAPAAATILGPLLGIDRALITWLITIFFIVVAITGGMVGASWIGVVHTAVMFFGLAIVSYGSVKSVGGMPVLKAELPEYYFSLIGNDPMTTIANALGTAISFLASSNVTTALFGSKDQKSANRGVFLAGLLVIPFALMPAFVGMSAKIAMPDISSSNALFLMARSLGPWMSGILSMSIIAAIWSTAPTLLIIISATLTKDFYVTRIKPNASEKQQLYFSFVVIAVTGILGTWMGINARSILNNMLGAFQIRSIVGVVLLVALVWPRVNSRSAFWSMLCGGAVSAFWFFTGSPFGIAPLWPGTFVGIAVLIPLTLMNKEKISEGYQKYLDALKE